MPSKNLGRVSIVPKGTWNANTVYNRLDAVVHDGSSWLAKKQNAGQMPGEGSDTWQMLAERGADGPKGIDGAPGKGLTIIGHFDTVESLEASVTMPEPGDAYSIGDAEPYDIYTYDGVSQSWFNNGPIKGDPGPQGPKGDTGDIGPQGPKGDTGDPGPQGEPGRGLNISGTVKDALSLPVSAENGDVWNVGTIPPYDLYLYNNGIWTNMGPLQGPEGPQGPAGPAGVDGADGAPGPAGADGVSCTHEWNGTVLSITSASGTSSADLRGPAGADGKDGADGAVGPQGPAGADGSDASVTAENIKTALGFTPGKMVRNLLDNSDFTNPVNQRGLISGDINWQYFIDRWILAGSGGTNVHFEINPISGSINVSTSTGEDIYMVQRLPIGVLDTSKSYTYAFESSDKNIFISPAALGQLEESIQFVAVIPSGTSVRWISLYEGEYTAETLPEYQPKGYAAELTECLRYYINLNPNNNLYDTVAFGMGWDIQNEVDFVVNLPVPMRKTPSFTNQNNLRIYDATTASLEELPSSTVILLNQHGLKIVCSGVNGWIQGRMYALNTLANNVSIGLTAEL